MRRIRSWEAMRVWIWMAYEMRQYLVAVFCCGVLSSMIYNMFGEFII